MAIIMLQYTAAMFWRRDFQYSRPITSPYTANSKAIATAVGYSFGVVNSILRSRGRIKPTPRPHCQPQMSPHSSTGMCIGNSIFPIWGICPVKKGSTSPMARNMADRVSLTTVLFCFAFIFFVPP